MDLLAIPDKVKNIISHGESHFREFKSGYEGPPSNKVKRNPKDITVDIGRTLVGFSNADGGDLLIGVEDDGQITGLSYSEDVLHGLLNSYKTSVHKDTPLLNVSARKIEIDNKMVLFFSVEKSTKYITLTSDGRCLQRADKETIPVSVEQLKFERQEQISREYDRQFVDGGEVKHLDFDLISKVGETVAAGFSNEKVIQLLGLSEYSTIMRLKRAALLLFSNDISKWHPRSEVRIMRISGTELKTGRDYNVLSDEIERGNIFELITKSWEKLRPHLVETKFSQDALFRQRIMYPEDACREALINAIAHRDYSIEGRNIEIKIYDDRMEVTSPGGLLSNIKVDDLKKLEGVHQSRNALIARVLKEVGYMREMGEGIRRIFSLMKQNDLVEPEIVSDQNQFSLILHSQSVFTQQDQQYVEAFNFLNVDRNEMMIILLGKSGSLLSPKKIYEHLELIDWDDYRIIIENAQTKGILYNALSENAKNTIATKEKISKRDVERLKVRTPKECEESLKEVFSILKSIGPVDKINRSYVSNVTSKLSANSAYRASSPTSTLKLFKLLNLIDNSSKPTQILENIWGVTKSAKKEERHVKPRRKSESLKSLSKKEVNLSDDILLNEIYTEGLDYFTTEEDLIKLFSPFGKVYKVSIPMDYRRKTGRGFAFIILDSEENAKKAIKNLNNTTFKERTIRLNFARKKEV